MTTPRRADPPAQHRWCPEPLGTYLEGFRALLDARGYARTTAQQKLPARQHLQPLARSPTTRHRRRR